MKVVVAAFNQEKALVGAFSVITNLRMELFEALLNTNLNMKKSPRCRQADDFLGRVCWLHIQPDITKDIFFRNTLGNELDCVEGGATPGLIQNNYDIRRQVSNHKKLEVAQFLVFGESGYARL